MGSHTDEPCLPVRNNCFVQYVYEKSVTVELSPRGLGMYLHSSWRYSKRWLYLTCSRIWKEQQLLRRWCQDIAFLSPVWHPLLT